METTVQIQILQLSFSLLHYLPLRQLCPPPRSFRKLLRESYVLHFLVHPLCCNTCVWVSEKFFLLCTVYSSPVPSFFLPPFALIYADIKVLRLSYISFENCSMRDKLVPLSLNTFFNHFSLWESTKISPLMAVVWFSFFSPFYARVRSRYFPGYWTYFNKHQIWSLNSFPPSYFHFL